MKSILPIFPLILLLGPSFSFAQAPTPTPPPGYGVPSDYERKANGLDRPGYRGPEDPAEDFQIIFITSAPFTALVSYGLTGLASLALRDSFSVDGDYLIPFIAGTVAGSATIASLSVLTNKYPGPAADIQGPAPSPGLRLALAQARF